MRVFQVLVTLSFGDAVSNDCFAIKQVLLDAGYTTAIYAENIDKRVKDSHVKKYNSLPKLKASDVVLYHLSTGSEMNSKIMDLPCRKFVIYHNITPSQFFTSYNGTTARLCAMGHDETLKLKDTFEAGFCDSQFNLDQLRSYGYTCPLVVRPVLIPFEDYKKKPDQEVIEKMNEDKDTVKNVIFVGRIAPNKCQQDIISVAYAYKKLYDDKVRFILVGSSNGTEKYQNKLEFYSQLLELDNVEFTGQISFPAILAYYKTASAFLCLSEHEGFCVPVLEAMCFDVPVLAYNSTAVPETMGDSGIILEDKDPATAAAYLHELLLNESIRKEVIDGQRERLKRFSYETVSKEFLKTLEEFIKREAK